jgi:hypothetical protein
VTGDPGAVETLADLAAALGHLRGTRSYGDLDRAVRPGRLARSTLSDLLTGRSLPTRDTLDLFLAACGLGVEAREPWLAAWERVGTGHLPRPPGAVRVREARPRLLGVHAAIRVGHDDDELPPYVPRDLDPHLRGAVAAASAHGGFVLLVGGSSVGKTRALVEAVRAVLPHWWLLHPGDAEEVRVLAGDPPPRTVVWLDELQRYLDGLPASAVRHLVAAGSVLVATLWPGEYGARTAPRERGRSEGGGLLDLADVITVPAALSTAERHRAEALAGDRRIRTALDTPDAGFTQVLAAGPALIHWWENAPDYGGAVITAALDARRVGAHAPVTRDLLAAAAPGYLTAGQQATAPPDWLDRALAYATTPLHGATAALSPVAAGMGTIGGYAVADYLHQHARRARRTVPLPDPAWRALVDHHHPDDTYSLADGAERRGRPAVAAALYRGAADAGDRVAARRLATLLARPDRAGAPGVRARDPLAERPPGPRDDRRTAGPDEVEDLRRRAADGDVDAAALAADLLRERGDLASAVAVLRHHVDADRYAAYRADMHDRADQFGSDLVGEIMTAWVDRLTDRLADLLRAQSDVGELTRLADAGHWRSGDHVAALLAEQGRESDLRRRADTGDHAAVHHLAALLIGQGRAGDALDLLRRRPTAWSTDRVLMDLLAGADLLDELRILADDGNPYAAASLVAALAGQGRLDELEAEVHAGTPGAARRTRADRRADPGVKEVGYHRSAGCHGLTDGWA